MDQLCEQEIGNPTLVHKKWLNMSASKVRLEERLKIKIGEVKNLLPRNHGTAGYRDVYCTLTLDREEIFRTATIDRTLNPFFGEEFQFEVPREFRYLSLYVYDRDHPTKQNKAVGKVAIKKEELHEYDGKDHWFPLLPVDPDSEIEGKVHIDIKIEPYVKNGCSTNFRVTVRVLDCSDLTVINGACDPYATVGLWCAAQKQDLKRTKGRKKTRNPHFNEAFVFDVPAKFHLSDHENIYGIKSNKTDHVEVRITLWHDSPGMFGNVFLGEVRIPLKGLKAALGHNAWYLLQPRENTKSLKTELGSVRLKIHYTSDHVFSSHFYDKLRELILMSPNVEPISSSAVYILGEIVSNKVDAVQPMARIFLHHGQIIQLIKALAKNEISKVTDPNTIFRGNTLVSKFMDEFMRLVGQPYLQSTLQGIVSLILREKKSCEIDPSRLRDTSCLDTNLASLKEYIEKTLTAITNSALNCPRLMCQAFHVLKELAVTYFSDTREVRYSVVSGFIFLRFFAPAILGPKLFDLTHEQIDPNVTRTLTLISKTIQSMGNLVSSRSSQQIPKEQYMSAIYCDFFTDAKIHTVRNFLEIISSTSCPGYELEDTAIILKEGMMIKRAQGRKRFGLKNFKQRYFSLTTQDLNYSKSKGERVIYRIPLHQILAVEKVQEDSFKMKNMFQIVHPQRTLYIQANNCVEEKEWMDILTKICEANANRLERYHPGAYINGHWLCCKAVLGTAAGCSEVSVRVDTNLHLHIDSDREMERIHSLFLRYISHLKSLIDICECQAVYMGNSPSLCSAGFIEDSPSCFKTLKAIQQCVMKLEREHLLYNHSTENEMQYGSKFAPIGDDNYLRKTFTCQT